MHISSAAIKPPLIAVCLMMLCGSTEAADDCSVADVLVNSWVRMARSYSSGLPTTKAIRRELEFKTDDVALKGYSYSPPSQESETAAKHFILFLQGSASSAAQLAETASGLALAAKREVFVYEYRGYASGSTVHPTAAAIQSDIDAIIDSLSERGRVPPPRPALVRTLPISTLTMRSAAAMPRALTGPRPPPTQKHPERHAERH